MRLRRWRLRAGLIVLVCLLAVLIIRVATSGVASVKAGVLEQVVRVVPHNADAHFALGQAYFDVNDLPHAIESFQTAIQVNPEYAEVYDWLSQCYWDQGQHVQAIETWKLAKVQMPDWNWPYVRLASDYNDLGRYEESIAEWKELVGREPNTAGLHVLLGNTCRAAGRCEEAKVAYEQAIAIDPKHKQAQKELSKLAAAIAAAHVDSGKSRFRSHDFKGAIQASEEAIRLQPANAEAHLLIGGSYFQLNQCDKAITYLKKVFTLTPAQPKTTALAHFELGTVYLHLRKTDLAMEECEIVKTLDPEMAEELHAALTKNSRDLSAPSSRLDGVWKTDQGEGVEYRLTEPSLKVGVFRLHHRTGQPSQWIRFKVLSEEPSGDKLVVREFRPTELLRQLDPHFQWSPVTLCIPKDGRSMTREYELFGDNTLAVYRYVECSSTAEQRANKATPVVSENAPPLVEAIGVSTGKRPYALVDGTLVYEGSIVNGFKIVRIHADKVEFEKDGQVTGQTLN